jgi:HSP20 family molecular chaperone IbpA
MMARDVDVWMWWQACDALARTERLHRQFFHLQRAPAPAWEPPADILETDQDVIVMLALPGVDSGEIHASIEGADLVVTGLRTFPRELQDALIHRLELPHGRFARRIPLPAGRYTDVRREVSNGCLLVRLGKARQERSGG